MNAGDNERVDMRDIGDKIRANLFRDRSKSGVIKFERIGAHADPDKLRLFATRDFANLVHVETTGFLIRTVRDLDVVFSRETHLPTMSKVSAVRHGNAHNLIADVEERAIYGVVRRRAGIRLNVHMFATEESLAALDRKVLNLVDELVPFVIARARIAFRILVRENGTAGFKNVFDRIALRGDHLEGRALVIRLFLNKIVNLSVGRLKIRLTFNGHGCLSL